MQKQFQKKKRKMKKSWNQFLKRASFLFKLGLVLIFLFFIVLFVIIKPYQSDEGFSFLDGVDKEDFIVAIAPHAQKAQREYGTRPSVLIAQAALESNWGESELAQEANNYFGIKGTNSDPQYATREFWQNEWETTQASFKAYESMEDSVMDYADLMKNGTSWNSDIYNDVIEAETYKEAANAVQEAGYATDPDYAEKIIRIIEQYQLYELDR